LLKQQNAITHLGGGTGLQALLALAGDGGGLAVLRLGNLGLLRDEGKLDVRGAGHVSCGGRKLYYSLA
jgi:hypothetical protein